MRVYKSKFFHVGSEKYHVLDLKRDGFSRYREEERRRRWRPIGTRKTNAERCVASDAICFLSVLCFRFLCVLHYFYFYFLLLPVFLRFERREWNYAT